MPTFGPDYDEKIDGLRIKKQMQAIRDFMLNENKYITLQEIETALGYPQASISAQLRHLRKSRFGGYLVEKRRRGTEWEYFVNSVHFTANVLNVPARHKFGKRCAKRLAKIKGARRDKNTISLG
jgi:transcriptional antiterminator